MRLMLGLCLRINVLVYQFKKAAVYLIDVREKVLEHTSIQTGIKSELMTFSVNCNQKVQVVGTICRGSVTIHSSKHTVYSIPHIDSPDNMLLQIKCH